MVMHWNVDVNAMEEIAIRFLTSGSQEDWLFAGSWIVVVQEHSRWLLEYLLAWWYLNDNEGGCAILDFFTDWFFDLRWWNCFKEETMVEGDGGASRNNVNHDHKYRFSLVIEGGGGWCCAMATLRRDEMIDVRRRWCGVDGGSVMKALLAFSRLRCSKMVTTRRKTLQWLYSDNARVSLLREIMISAVGEDGGGGVMW